MWFNRKVGLLKTQHQQFQKLLSAASGLQMHLLHVRWTLWISSQQIKIKVEFFRATVVGSWTFSTARSMKLDNMHNNVWSSKKYKMPSPYHQWKSFCWSAKNSNRHFRENATVHKTLLAQQAGHYPQIIIWNSSYSKRCSGRSARSYFDQLMKDSSLGIDQILNTVEDRELRDWFVMCVRRSTTKYDQCILWRQS